MKKGKFVALKRQCEVKPVPTELEYIVEGHVTSTAQRETKISNLLIHLLNAFQRRNTNLLTREESRRDRNHLARMEKKNKPLWNHLSSVRSLLPSLLSDLCLAPNTTSPPRHHHHLFNPFHYLLHLPFVTGLLIFIYTLLHLRLCLTLSVSLWERFSVGTGCGSAGSHRIAAGRLFLGGGFERSCHLLLLALERIRMLRYGRGLRVSRRLWNSLNQREGWRLGVWLGKGMEVSRRGNLGLGLGLVRWWRLWVGLGLRLLLYLDLLKWVVLRRLEPGGGCSVFTEAAGLSCTVDLTQVVQGLTLGVFQQVGLALRFRQRETERKRETAWWITHNHIGFEGSESIGSCLWFPALSYFVPSPRTMCFHSCPLVCLSLSRITQKQLKGF